MTSTVISEESAESHQATVQPSVWSRLIRHPSVVIGGIIIALILAMVPAAPLLSSLDPTDISPRNRNKPPGAMTVHKDDEGNKTEIKAIMGTDKLGRDVYSRVIYGARVSLIVGLSVATIAVSIGLFIGMMAGYFRIVDAIVMRIMDGLMAIPSILLAIALVSLSGASLFTVILAIVIPEIPRVVRLVRSIVLTVREEPYVEAAISVGTPTAKILTRHVLPNTVAPLIVQGTFICGSAILLEAILSFLGVGVPPDIPTWGNIMAQGRDLFQIYPHNIFYPGIFLTLTVLAINMLGDGLRDTIDPRMSKEI